MFGRMSPGRFALFCTLVAVAAAVVALCYMATFLSTLQDMFGFEINWVSWATLVMFVVLACGTGASAVVLMKRQRAKQVAEAARPSAAIPVSRVDLLPLDRPEKGMIDLFPNQRFFLGIYGAVMTVSLLFVVVHGLLVPSQILETLRSVVTAAAWFFITSTAIFYLHKSLAISSAAFYLCIALLMPLGALFAVGRGDLFGLLSYSLAALFCWTMSCCWWTLANLQESNRFLLRAPYKMILSKPALAVAADIQFHARKNKKMCGLCYDVSRFPFVRCGIFIGDKLSDYFLRRARNENWILCPSAQSFARCCRPNHRRRC